MLSVPPSPLSLAIEGEWSWFPAAFLPYMLRFGMSLSGSPPITCPSPPSNPALPLGPTPYCSLCDHFLNGNEQWHNHLGGKRHRRRKLRQLGPAPKTSCLPLTTDGALAYSSPVTVAAGYSPSLPPSTIWSPEVMRSLLDLVRRLPR